jgi:hypothetical protein
MYVNINIFIYADTFICIHIHTDIFTCISTDDDDVYLNTLQQGVSQNLYFVHFHTDQPEKHKDKQGQEDSNDNKK